MKKANGFKIEIINESHLEEEERRRFDLELEDQEFKKNKIIVPR